MDFVLARNIPLAVDVVELPLSVLISVQARQLCRRVYLERKTESVWLDNGNRQWMDVCFKKTTAKKDRDHHRGERNHTNTHMKETSFRFFFECRWRARPSTRNNVTKNEPSLTKSRRYRESPTFKIWRNRLVYLHNPIILNTIKNDCSFRCNRSENRSICNHQHTPWLIHRTAELDPLLWKQFPLQSILDSSKRLKTKNNCVASPIDPQILTNGMEGK